MGMFLSGSSAHEEVADESPLTLSSLPTKKVVAKSLENTVVISSHDDGRLLEMEATKRGWGEIMPPFRMLMRSASSGEPRNIVRLPQSRGVKIEDAADGPDGFLVVGVTIGHWRQLLGGCASLEPIEKPAVSIAFYPLQSWLRFRDGTILAEFGALGVRRGVIDGVSSSPQLRWTHEGMFNIKGLEGLPQHVYPKIGGQPLVDCGVAGLFAYIAKREYFSRVCENYPGEAWIPRILTPGGTILVGKSGGEPRTIQDLRFVAGDGTLVKFSGGSNVFLDIGKTFSLENGGVACPSRSSDSSDLVVLSPDGVVLQPSRPRLREICEFNEDRFFSLGDNVVACMMRMGSGNSHDPRIFVSQNGAAWVEWAVPDHLRAITEGLAPTKVAALGRWMVVDYKRPAHGLDSSAVADTVLAIYRHGIECEPYSVYELPGSFSQARADGIGNLYGVCAVNENEYAIVRVTPGTQGNPITVLTGCAEILWFDLRTEAQMIRILSRSPDDRLIMVDLAL